MLNSVGLQNPGADAFIEQYIPFLQQINTVIIANIAGNTEENYVEVARRVSACDAVDMVELNISCPNVKAGGMAFGILPASVEKITCTVKKICAKPLVVKLSPNVASIADNARAAEAGGADAISLINTLGRMAIDYKTRRPQLANIVGGLSGPAVKPVALKMVYECYKAVQVPIIGMGGITTAADVFEFMMAGAAAVQVGSANLFDPMAAFNLVEEIQVLMKEQNIVNISELTGSLIIDNS
jgi:dihydroorotate dehydrogenase (NAD+) catalytic subunit